MNIVHIVRGNYTPLALNGVYMVIDNISIALSKQMVGGKVVVCSVNTHVENDIFQSAFYEHIQFKEHPLRFFLDKKFKAFLLSCPNDTVFHFHSVFIPWFLPAVRLLKKNGYKRVVLTPHGQYVDEAMNVSLKKRIFFRYFDRKVIKTVDAVQLIGATEQNSYITSNAKEFHFIPNGCKSQPAVEVKQTPCLTFGYMGRLDTEQKGLDILIQAFAFYRKQGGKAALRIAGDGPDKASLERMCEILELGKSVCFVGKVIGDEKWNFFKTCNFFLHSSRWDGLPTGCLEAAASGTALIVSVETNLGTYLNKFKSGFVYLSDGRPVQALADRMFEAERLFGQKDDYQEMCNNANRMICEELNWDNIADMDMKKLYNIKK